MVEVKENICLLFTMDYLDDAWFSWYPDICRIILNTGRARLKIPSEGEQGALHKPIEYK